MLPSAPHFGWQHIFLGCEDSTLAPLQMANISLLWWPAGSGEFPFFADDCMKLQLPQSWIGKSWNYMLRLPPCGYLVTLHNITRDHHPSSNLALHWPSHPSKKTTPSCQVDLLICTQKKKDWLKISPKWFFLVPLGPWLIGLIDAERHVIWLKECLLTSPSTLP